jgi:hypothetical protein
MTAHEMQALARIIVDASGPRRKAILTPVEEKFRLLAMALQAEGMAFPDQKLTTPYQIGGKKSGETRAWMREVRRIAVDVFFEAMPASYKGQPFSDTTLARLRDDLTEHTKFPGNIPVRTLKDDLLALGKRSRKRC